MATQTQTHVTPVGRLVAGDLFEARDKDYQGNTLVVKSGPNAGQPRVEFFAGLAIRKDDPQWPVIHGLIMQTARAGFPNLFDANGNCLSRNFSFKITDGDDQMQNLAGVRPCDKEGYPGHWVIGFASGFAPQLYDRDLRVIAPESKSIKKGDYIRIGFTVASNNNPTNPGVYLNLRMVQFSHSGDEISSGPSAAEVFGAVAMPSAPAGAATAPTPTLATMPGQAAPAPANVQPAPDFLNPEKYVASNGTAYTRDELKAFNFTDEQINALPRA